MKMHTLLTLCFLVFFPVLSLTASPSPDHFLKGHRPKHQPKEFLEVTHPLPSDHLTPPPPSCIHPILLHPFANTINQPPFSTPYYPPSASACPSPWSAVVLNFHVTSKGNQYDRISALWLGGVELLRTSTAQPTKDGIFWLVRKDVTRYSSLFSKRNLRLSIMLENIVNSVYTGVYHVNATLLFYSADPKQIPPFTQNHTTQSVFPLSNSINLHYYQSPADLIIPISSSHDPSRGYWFIIENQSDVHFKNVRIPKNTRRLVLELYISFHGNDEFWYSNPSDSYIKMNNLTTGRGNGAYREVFVTIDGEFVGSEVPFPVVFTGGVNPLFWEPVVAIGAFDLPSYDFDLTPFLGLVLDGKDHAFGIGVTDGISYWLVDANLHLWLDGGSIDVIAKNVVHYNPTTSIRRREAFKLLDGSFSIRVEKVTLLEGWVKSSLGNLTTTMSRQFKFRNMIKFQGNGTYKAVKQSLKVKTRVMVSNDVDGLISHVSIKRMYPLQVVTATLPGSKKDTYMLLTNVSHAMIERYRYGKASSYVFNKQFSNGWMEVKDHDVIKGEAITNQTYRSHDDFGCYVRTIAVKNGTIIVDIPTSICPSVM